MSDQSGGKMVAQGIDGCVFIPKLKCQGDKDDFIRAGKLMIDKITNRSIADQEFKIAQKIAEIPLSSNYFVVASDICTPSKTQTDPDLTKCEIQVELKDTKILRMPYGGVCMYDYKFNLKTFSPLEFTRHLLEAGALMALNGVIHNDLHQGNIVIDDQTVPRIIDFGRSLFSYEQVSEKDFVRPYSARYFQEPPDYFLINAKINDYSKNLSMRDLINKRKTMVDQMNILFDRSTESILASMEEFTEMSTSYKKMDFVGWFHHHWRTIDSWAIGFRLMDCFFNLLYFREFTETWNKEGGFILPILKRMLEINPFRRIDCVQALDMLDALFYTSGENIIIEGYGKDWLDKVGRVRI